MSSGLAWHPRHPDRQRPLRREDAVVQYSEPSPSTYVDEAEVLPGEVAAVEREFADAPTRRAVVSPRHQTKEQPIERIPRVGVDVVLQLGRLAH